MLVKLIILHGQLQDRRSRNSKQDLEIRRPRFVIGSASDCGMCCRSNRISPHHCQLRLEPEKVVLQDLSSETGTYVNGRRIEHDCILQNGDRLRIGRLEFEVLIEDPSPVWELGPRVDSDTIHDAMADTVCNLLLAADERDRIQRLQNPEMRQLSVQSAGERTRLQGEQTAKPERVGRAVGKANRRRPGRLPTRVRSAEDSSAAATEALREYFTKRKVYIPLRRSQNVEPTDLDH